MKEIRGTVELGMSEVLPPKLGVDEAASSVCWRKELGDRVERMVRRET
jgi:hypothetical protein